jgi:hypothetical protein
MGAKALSALTRAAGPLPAKIQATVARPMTRKQVFERYLRYELFLGRLEPTPESIEKSHEQDGQVGAKGFAAEG